MRDHPLARIETAGFQSRSPTRWDLTVFAYNGSVYPNAFMVAES